MPKGVYPRRLRPLAERLWAKVDRRGPDECWEWQGYRDKRGYGQIGRGHAGSGMAWVHRVAFELVNGPLRPGEMACHHCDNPPCCNPAHLFAGNAAANNGDAKRKGRNAAGERHAWRRHPQLVRRGERHHAARLSDTQVRDIRRRAASGAPRRTLASDFDVSRQTIDLIVAGKTWRHLLGVVA